MKEDKMLESVREISYNLAKMLLEHDLFLSFDPKEREFVFANREDITSKDKDEDADIPVISVSLKDINVVISGEKSKKKVKMNQDEKVKMNQDESEDKNE